MMICLNLVNVTERIIVIFLIAHMHIFNFIWFFVGILSPSGPFLTPSQSPSIQHSPRLQPSPSPSQSPFQPQQQQDVLIVTNNNQHYINTFTTTQEQVSVKLCALSIYFDDKKCHYLCLLGSKNWNAKSTAFT
jgi:hypothetical protein